MTITVQAILNPDIDDLELENWKHLLRWPGSLVTESSSPVATDSPATITEPGIKDFERDTLTPQTDAPYPDRQAPIPPAPTVSADELRQQLEETREPVGFQEQPFRGKVVEFARGNRAAAFDAAQTSAYMVPNEIYEDYEPLVKLPLTSHSPSREAGALWMLDQFTQETIGIPLITLEVLQIVGVESAAYVAYRRSLEDMEQVELELRIQALERRILLPVLKARDFKINAIDRELQRWAEAGRVPVVAPGPDKSLVRSLTLCNVATVRTACAKLRSLAYEVSSFALGASDVTEALRQQLSPALSIKRIK